MKKGLILIVIALAIFFGACKKAQPQYCYRDYQYVWYYFDNMPNDTLFSVDSATKICYTAYTGDTIHKEHQTTFGGGVNPNGQSIHSRDSTFEVYIH